MMKCVWLFVCVVFELVVSCCALHFAPPSAFSSPSGSSYPYPCPTPPPHGERVSGAFAWHHDFQNEWYYVSGSLVASTANGHSIDLQPMGYQISTTVYNLTTATLRIENNIAVSSEEHYSAEGIGDSVFGDFNLTFSNSAMSTSYLILQGTPGDVGSVYSIQAANANMTLNLTLTALVPLMYQGDGGYYGYESTSDNACSSYYYVTIPRLLTTGTIRLNDVTHQVTGYSWFDHEWGGAFPGWYWLGVNIGQNSIMITVPRINGTNRYDYSIMDVQDMDGKMSRAQIVNIETLGNWTSPSTGIIYPTEVRFYSNHREFPSFSTQPFFDNQEAGPILHFWEGDVKVFVDSGPFKGSQGVGYYELMNAGTTTKVEFSAISR